MSKKCTPTFIGTVFGGSLHNYETKKEVNQEGITVSKKVCSKCGDTEILKGEKIGEKSYPIYVCTAPFGVFTRELSGSLEGSSSGMLSFTSGSLRGSLSETEKEVYIVKYLDGNILKTTTFNAKDTGIIIDGTFRLSTDEKIYYEAVDGTLVEKSRYISSWHSDFKIHFPELPKLSEATTKVFQQLSFKQEAS
jgi:hypothetical protein